VLCRRLWAGEVRITELRACVVAGRPWLVTASAAAGPANAAARATTTGTILHETMHLTSVPWPQLPSNQGQVRRLSDSHTWTDD
jgi:hypothetical protein